MTDIVPSSVLTGGAGVIDAVVGAETVLLASDSSRYHGLDPIGSRVWQLLDGDRSVGEICRLLGDEFAVEPDRCAREVLAFLDDLAAHDLVVLVAVPAR